MKGILGIFLVVLILGEENSSVSIFRRGVTEKEETSESIDFLFVLFWYLKMDCFDF